MVNSYPPLGLAYLAAVVESEGHSVALFDLGLEPDSPIEHDVERVAAYSPDLVGFTAMTNNYHSAEQTIASLKERVGCPIVVGGPHATVFPERVVADPHIDYVVYGEGERTLCELVQAISSMGPAPSAGVLRSINGLCFISGGQVIRNPARPLISDLDSLPFPARHLLDLSRYPLYALNGERMVTLLSSRGCPYDCSYCFKGIMGRTYRQRSPENVVAEIRSLIDEYGYRNFYFIDDLFTLDRQRLAAITRRIMEARLDIRWQCLARVDRVTPDLLELMYRSGCRQIHYGIESGNPDILRAVGKKITLAQVRKAVAWTAQAGILAKGYFMLGLPGDTERTVRQTVAFATELGLDQAMFSLTTPFPGTRLWDELVKRRPDVEFNCDFSRAFYYINYDRMIKPFLNVSEVSDQRLELLAYEAQSKFQESKRRRKYITVLGPVLGKLAYGLSTIRPLRKVGRALLRARLVRGIRGLSALGERNVREEYSRKWS